MKGEEGLEKLLKVAGPRVGALGAASQQRRARSGRKPAEGLINGNSMTLVVAFGKEGEADVGKRTGAVATPGVLGLLPSLGELRARNSRCSSTQVLAAGRVSELSPLELLLALRRFPLIPLPLLFDRALFG